MAKILIVALAGSFIIISTISLGHYVVSEYLKNKES